MARRSSSTIAEDDLFFAQPQPTRLQRAPVRDLDEEEDSPFLRGQNRVSVRRGPLPKKTARRLWWSALGVLVCVAVAFASYAVYDYGQHNWHFRIDSGDNIQLAGNAVVSRSSVMEIMGSDIGRNIYFVPLGQRKAQLEQLPWVESASVMRFAPNQLRVEVVERKPVAFARVGTRILHIDATGHLLEPPPGKRNYHFPVIAGVLGTEPLSTLASRMKIYAQLVHELDSSGAHYSQDLSEIDLSDPEDVKITAPDQGGEVLLHLGSENFLERYQTYLTHVSQWRQQASKLDSVDLRFDGQVVVNAGEIRQPVAEKPVATAANNTPAKTSTVVEAAKGEKVAVSVAMSKELGVINLMIVSK